MEIHYIMSRPNKDQFASIPLRWVGPLTITGPDVDATVSIPLATFETPLWASVQRGADVCSHAGGIRAIIIDERMTRSVVLQANNAIDAAIALSKIKQQHDIFQAIIDEISDYTQLLNMHSQIVGNLLYLRFEFKTGDAAGHNMSTLAADHLLERILSTFPELTYVSISGNYCADKKVSAVNGVLGRGKYVVAEVSLSRDECKKFLRTTPEKIVQLNIKKNLIGGILAGSLRTANAHFANMLLSFYLATGQDAANIIEGSQGIVYAEVREDQLYFAVTLPNVIVGTVGNGKALDFVVANLRELGCLEERAVGDNARRLAIIAASAVLCGELSLLAAQTNPRELMRSHLALERKREKS